MRARLLCLLSALILSLPVVAQSVTRPVLHVGDTIYLSRDQLPTPVDLAETGDDIFWDMSRLLSPFVHQSLVRPDANGGMILNGADDVDKYLIEKGDGLYISKLAILDPSNGGRLTISIDPPVPYVKGVRPGDRWTYSGTMSYTSPANGRAVKLSLNIRAEVDASGELYSPTLKYDVLRERRDVEVAQFPGSAPVNLSDLGLPCGFNAGRCYAFLSQVSPVPVAMVQTDALNQIKQVVYITHPWAGTVIQQIPRKPEVFIYPNPSFGNVRFDFLNLVAGYYDLEIYNILGSKIRTEHIYINGQKTLPLDLSRLKKGTYIYRLVDSQKNTIRSKRLVIITP